MVDFDLVIDVFPQIGDVIVHDGGRDEAGVDHLEDVLVLELLVGDDNVHRPLAFGGERGVEPPEAVVIT